MMRRNFTRLDFGWWGFLAYGDKWRDGTTIGTQPDMWEYGAAKAAAWDCPATIQANLGKCARHARANDVMETMRRWEDVRARRLLTAAQKEALKDTAREFHLVPDGRGGYDLVEWEQIDVAGGKSTAFARSSNPIRPAVATARTSSRRTSCATRRSASRLRSSSSWRCAT